MMIEITSSGGFSGRLLPEKTQHADLDKMSQTDRATYCAAFAPEVLNGLALLEGPIGAADTRSYRITVTDDAGTRFSYVLDELVIPAETLDLIDAME